jgi:MFS family permease
VQGIGGARLIPGSLAIIGASFPDERRGQAIGTWSALTAIATAVGPVLGGWLVDHLDWRWVFFVNVPLAVVVLLIGIRRLPESRDESARGNDIWGTLLATIGLGCLTYGLVQAGSTALNNQLVLSCSCSRGGQAHGRLASAHDGRSRSAH